MINTPYYLCYSSQLGYNRKENGVPTNVLQEGLGHSYLATTEAYLDCFEDEVVDDVNELISN